MSVPSRARVVAFTALAALAAFLVLGAPSSGAVDRLSLVGFAVPKAADAAAETAFARTPAGRGAVWTESYGASGEQSRAVTSGLAADYVHFSIAPDITRLVDAGLVSADWDAGPHHGIATQSVVALVVRPGNPLHITGWDDLIRPGVEVVTPHPGSSGAARWNILAAWTHVTGAGGSTKEATDFLGALLDHVAALPSSGRDATAAFQAGSGDVLLSYENEAILARQNGAALDYVIPADTLKIENPAAVTIGADPRAHAFADFVHSAAGQRQYVAKGFRPLDTVHDTVVGRVEGANDPTDPFPRPRLLFTIDRDLGGWDAVTTKFFDKRSGIVTRLLSRTGRS